MNNVEAMNFIKQQRSIMSSQKRKRSSNRNKQRAPYPYAVEKSYAVKISDYSLEFIKNIDTVLDKFVSAHFDSDSSDIDTLWTQMEEELQRYYGDAVYNSGNLGIIIAAVAEKVFGSNKYYMQKQLEVIAGVPFSIDTPWWDEVKNLWMQQNYSLIKTMSSDYITKLNQLLLTGISNGYGIDKISAQIQALQKDITGAHSRLIARDQIGKINALVQKNQATYIGMNSYYWQTCRDEKVRGNPSGKYPKAIPSHWIMDNLLCTWDDPDVYSTDLGKTWIKKTSMMESLQVGMAIQCRCVAAPSWNIFVKKIDSELEAA
jgi:hypothetical protein